MAEASDIEDMIRRFDSSIIEDKARSIAYSGRLVVINRSPEIVVYLGEDSDYVIVSKAYCSCPGFLRRLPGRVVGCSHVAAVRMGVWRHREVEISQDEVARVVWEVLTGGYTITLRRKILKT